MAINKVLARSGSSFNTLIDLTEVTATANDVMQGYTFHSANGQVYSGIFTDPTDAFVTGNFSTIIDTSNAITSIPAYAFYSCKNLQEVSLPVCTVLGYCAFQSCSNLISVYAPLATFYAGSTFYSCENLRNINVNNCTRTFSSAFMYCRNLPSISLPMCTLIDDGAFLGCEKLSIITVGTSTNSVCQLYGTLTTTFGATPIYDSSYLGYFGSIYVPDNFVNNYKTATNWAGLADRITGISNLPN